MMIIVAIVALLPTGSSMDRLLEPLPKLAQDFFMGRRIIFRARSKEKRSGSILGGECVSYNKVTGEWTAVAYEWDAKGKRIPCRIIIPHDVLERDFRVTKWRPTGPESAVTQPVWSRKKSSRTRGGEPNRVSFDLEGEVPERTVQYRNQPIPYMKHLELSNTAYKYTDQNGDTQFQYIPKIALKHDKKYRKQRMWRTPKGKEKLNKIIASMDEFGNEFKVLCEQHGGYLHEPESLDGSSDESDNSALSGPPGVEIPKC